MIFSALLGAGGRGLLESEAEECRPAGGLESCMDATSDIGVAGVDMGELLLLSGVVLVCFLGVFSGISSARSFALIGHVVW